jgi:L-alanine-DL-glutamate epimerase-like enolase superfamily enzyme
MGRVAQGIQRCGEVKQIIMRLAEYSLHPYRLRYHRPVRWSDIVEDAAPMVLLRLVADTGAVGVGEITVKPTWCGATARSLAASIEEMFVPLLRTIDLDDPSAVRATLDRIPENLAAKTIIDNACWDLFAARHRQPLWMLWGGKRDVELSWAVTRQAPAVMAAEAADMVSRYGFKTLKIKGGQGFETDLRGIREIRAATGDGVQLYVDANGFYRADEASDYAKALADAGITYLEDPCPLSPDATFKNLQSKCPIPLLVDFGCWSPRDAALFMTQGAKALSIKPGRFGLTYCRTIQEIATSSRCGVVAGLMGESALGTLTALQFASAIPDPASPAELTWYLAMSEQILTEPLHVTDGKISFPEFTDLASLIDWKSPTLLSGSL